MSARKLGRLAGLVFVLVTVFGGVGVQHLAGDSATAVRDSSQVIDWN